MSTLLDTDQRRAEDPAPPPGPAAAAPGDPRLGPISWPLPAQDVARRRALVMGLIALPLALWYLVWLLYGAEMGNPVLYGLLVGAESFNLAQAVGFWWTCSRQRMRGHKPALDPHAEVDVMIPVYDEPVEVVEPTVAAAIAMRGDGARVWLLDDGDRAELARMARRHGARYIARPDNVGAKAGNLNHALRLTSAPYVAVFDCDHVPRPEFLERTLGHLEEPEVAYVQTPQYYANTGSGQVASAAAAQQNLFFGPICRGKDGHGATFCCGTNVVFRRRALEEAGGFPEASVTEDFELSVHLHERGWRSAYVPEVLACGLGPEDMASYVSQQQRWSRGCLSAIPAVLRARLPWRVRLQYLLSATYFLSGWTLLVYMSLPVARIVLGAQPLAAATADQFLLHFGPYYVGALAAVALAGYGTYTFDAFATAAGNFWIHVQATVNAVLRRTARFVVTPKHGERRRQPRAVIPTMVAIATLVSVSAYGLTRSQGAATLNNVAFAGLHASILLIAIVPALRIRRSKPLLPDPPVDRPRRAIIRLPRPVATAALGVALLVPLAMGVVGSRQLEGTPDVSERAHDAAADFFTRYVDAGGRVVRRDQGGDTVSEGQAYAMLLAVALGDRRRFDRVWGWTRDNLQRPDGLLSFRWKGGEVAAEESATDADLDAARALVLAGGRFGDDGYRRAGIDLGRAVLDGETSEVDSLSVLVAGPWAVSPTVVNPSYFSPRAYAQLAEAGDDPRWEELATSSRATVERLTASGRALPPDWATVDSFAAEGERVTAGAAPLADPGATGGAAASTVGARSGLDAVRVAVRAAESCVAADRRAAASLWPLYRRQPGRAAYRLGGAPAGGRRHAASFVAAAAAADAAGERETAAGLLDRAQALDEEHPTYYGAAWVALGRVMLNSSALGGCPR
jgi:cellulose synthase (UDP-forming)